MDENKFKPHAKVPVQPHLINLNCLRQSLFTINGKANYFLSYQPCALTEELDYSFSVCFNT